MVRERGMVEGGELEERGYFLVGGMGVFFVEALRVGEIRVEGGFVVECLYTCY